ncbi:hypothetical protein PXH67_11025 [Streptomyces sp. P8-A8]|uniref:hypothetical protein n=1 Tax=Streptomyces sp. P8-A8 TaxID=3029759 RepID=UPI0036DCF443
MDLQHEGPQVPGGEPDLDTVLQGRPLVGHLGGVEPALLDDLTQAPDEAGRHVERYPFDDIAEYIRTKRAEFDAIVVAAGGGSAKLFHEAVTEANLLLVPVAPTKTERRKLVATFDEAEHAAARDERDVTPTS